MTPHTDIINHISWRTIMASAAVQTYLTPEEYLTFERKAIIKHEYRKGHIVAMSGASRTHSFITGDIFGELREQLKGKKCEVHSSDMRVRILSTNAYFYPDVVVSCEEPSFEDNVYDTLLNPRVIIEVLSPSTEGFDRGEKFEFYKQLLSLQEYLLVAQDQIKVEHFSRHNSEWILTAYCNVAEVVLLSSIDCELQLREVYARTQLV